MKHIHIISMIVEDNPGVLAKVTGLFARRNFNIDTVTVGKTDVESHTKIVIVVSANNNILEQIEKQCNKLIDVLEVKELPKEDATISELCLLKLEKKDDAETGSMKEIAEESGARMIDSGEDCILFEISSTPDKINEFISSMKKYNILDISRSGVTGIICK